MLNTLALALLAATYVDDPLTSTTFAGRGGSQGGNFTAAGWVTTGEPDAIWYELPETVVSGRVEYTVTGLSVGAGGTLSGVDHDLFTMYAAPPGFAEPVAYTPSFRNNDFKAFTRIFGNNEPGRAGAIKFELAACPRGSPWYHDTACPAGCGFDGIAYATGSPQNPGWDPTVSYRMVVEWGAGQFAFFRNGTLLGTITYAGTYAPERLRVRFGSPRHQGVYPGAAMMPIGLTFKDVLITGTPGTRTLACGEAPGPVDAGPPPPPVDAGTNSLQYAVLADVTAASWEAGVFPDVNDLNVEGTGTGPGALVYLRFPALPGPVDQATLRVHATTSPSAAGGSGVVCAVSDNSWSETALTWNTRPSYGTCTGAATSVDPDRDVEWDVTPLFKTGALQSVALFSTDPNGAHFFSKESGGAANGPKLLVRFAAVTPPVDAGSGDAGTTDAGQGGGAGGGAAGGAGGGGGGAAGGGAGGGGGGGVAGTGGGRDGREIDARGGCGCAAAGPGEVVVLGLLALARRRRRQ